MTEQEQAAQQPSEGLSLVSVFGGYRLHPTVWKPTEPAKALIFVCHGVGEYMGRYEELGSHLSQNGLLMFGHDHVGHGRSEGDRVYVEDIDAYVQDVIHHVELMKNDYPHLPCILMGHSMQQLKFLIQDFPSGLLKKPSSC
jgi:alpha-beta hydrolase superfamily lysophospholipase